jgi:glycosyltransferase involved in cell wall biosynthesis
MKYTIIIPFYDTIDFIEESLASICKQDNLIINDLQVLIINDGSNYDLQKIVDSFRKNNLKIEYHVKKNGN